MPLAAEKDLQHIGKTHPVANHDHDLIHELSIRLDSVWRYDQYIANAEDKSDLQDFWRDLKRQDIKDIDRLKALICKEIEKGCF